MKTNNTVRQNDLAMAIVGQPMPHAKQYCVAMLPDGKVVAAFQAATNEPTQVIREITGSYTMVFPDVSLASAKEHALEIMEAYIKD